MRCARRCRQARPEIVIHQLTALPKEGVRRASDIDATNRLRIEGTRNLLDAAIAAGARRFVGGSFALLPGAMSSPGSGGEPGEAVRSMESQMLEATGAARLKGSSALRHVLWSRQSVNREHGADGNAGCRSSAAIADSCP